MTRKKWTAREEVTDSLLKLREKKKWQVALRRYILEKNPSEQYAPYFGLDIDRFRHWIELQFSDNLHWENFGTHWQFEHIVPVTYFNFQEPGDLSLCWSFINIRVQDITGDDSQEKKIDIVAAKLYFETLYKETGFSLCLNMVHKLSLIESRFKEPETQLKHFITNNKQQLEKLLALSPEEFSSLNKGKSLEDIYLEREILRKFG